MPDLGRSAPPAARRIAYRTGERRHQRCPGGVEQAAPARPLVVKVTAQQHRQRPARRAGGRVLPSQSGDPTGSADHRRTARNPGTLQVRVGRGRRAHPPRAQRERPAGPTSWASCRRADPLAWARSFTFGYETCARPERAGPTAHRELQSETDSPHSPSTVHVGPVRAALGARGPGRGLRTPVVASATPSGRGAPMSGDASERSKSNRTCCDHAGSILPHVGATVSQLAVVAWEPRLPTPKRPTTPRRQGRSASGKPVCGRGTLPLTPPPVARAWRLSGGRGRPGRPAPSSCRKRCYFKSRVLCCTAARASASLYGAASATAVPPGSGSCAG